MVMARTFGNLCSSSHLLNGYRTQAISNEKLKGIKRGFPKYSIRPVRMMKRSVWFIFTKEAFISLKVGYFDSNVR